MGAGRRQANEGSALFALGAASLVLGLVLFLALFQLPGLGSVATLWRALTGWIALPVAVGLVVAGAGLLLRRDADPWRLPWGRVLALEAACLAGMALVALAAGSPAPSARGGGGLVGWALATVAVARFGRPWSALLLGGVALVGLLAVMRVGGRQAAAILDRLADALADDSQGGDAGPSDPGRPSVPGAPPDASRPGAARGPSGASGAGAGAIRAPAARAARATDPPTAVGSPGGRADAALLPLERPWRGDAATGAEPSVRQQRPRLSGAPQPRSPGAPQAGAARSTRDAPGRPSHLPPFDFLGEDRTETGGDETVRAMAGIIERTLASFGVPAEVVEIDRGPSVTRFGLRPGTVEVAGERRRVRVARITQLRRDLALALSTPTVRIEAPIPGRPLVGIEVPNPEHGVVGLRGLLASQAFQKAGRVSGMALALGRDVAGGPVVADLASLPHLLVAGATGSGKSVCLDAIVCSLLFQCTPDALRLVLVDPKRVELSRYGGLPHLVAPVVTEIDEVIGALRWASAEMDARYRRMSEGGARDRASYNQRSPAGEAPMPALVLVIDELADLMMTAADPTESLLVRLAQLGRATGIHLIVATQRPSVDVVTGLIKANIQARVAFAVASSTDSRVILDQPGAEALLGRGDMLYQAPDAASPRRAQGAYVSDAEIAEMVRFWSESHWSAPPRVPPWDDLVAPLDPAEALYEKARQLIEEGMRPSASMLQRRLRVGYRTARDLYDRLEAEGFLEGRRERDWEDDELGQ